MRNHRKPTHGRVATRGQVESMYAGMRDSRPPRPPAPPICPTCTGRLDAGTGFCSRCETWPLLADQGRPMDRFRQPTIDEDREALRTARQERLRANNLRITHALGGLEEYAWADIVADDYDAPTEADVEAAGRRAHALETVLELLRGLAARDAAKAGAKA